MLPCHLKDTATLFLETKADVGLAKRFQVAIGVHVWKTKRIDSKTRCGKFDAKDLRKRFVEEHNI